MTKEEVTSVRLWMPSPTGMTKQIVVLYSDHTWEILPEKLSEEKKQP